MSSVVVRRGGPLVLLALLGGTALAQPAAEAPSPFHYAFKGMLLGAANGLAVGYLAASDKGDWEPYAYGAGIGAITGGALGLTVGLVDSGAPGIGYFVLRDARYGFVFGGAVGVIAGALAGRDGESAATGAAWGVLGGTVLGAVVGIFDGRSRPPRHGGRPLNLTLASTRDGAAGTVWMPALVGSF